ncbi:hypothetical protein [Microbacterium proteolyticum]|uniref:hypothetical protein n=1 Tax=Microbacterium proteolyticum TaxID=1572644 RepID=UPI001FAD263E|nr:hypothetical protein [Microbacterium proteolyticum]MCI9856785.1 hypothetical protein [Microbacterium proteolyticum]
MSDHAEEASQREDRSISEPRTPSDSPHPAPGRRAIYRFAGAAGDPASRDGTDTPEEEGDASDEHDGDPRNEVAHASAAVVAADPAVVAELVEDIAEIRELLEMRSYSGPLPEADELYKYTESHQERIFGIAESFSTDESGRRDRIADAQIAQSNRAQWITPVLLILFGSAAVVFFAVGNTLAGIAFLAMPVLRFLGTFISSFALRREGKKEDSAKAVDD